VQKYARRPCACRKGLTVKPLRYIGLGTSIGLYVNQGQQTHLLFNT